MSDHTPVTNRRGRSRRGATLALALVAGLAAAFAPAVLTGSTGVDALQRAMLAVLVTFVGAHGHRQSWLVAGALCVLPARGFSLVLVIVGLAIAAAAARTRRRSKDSGAVAVGLLINAILWFPGVGPLFLSPLVGLGAIVVLMTSGWRQLRGRQRLALSASLAVGGLFVLLCLAATSWAAVSARGDVEVGTASARKALASVRRGDSAAARSSLAKAQRHLTRADRTFAGTTLAPAHLVPGLSQQLRAVQVSVQQALAISDAADALVATDYDQLRYRGRLDLAQITALQPQSSEVQRVLTEADRNLAHISKGWLVPPLRTRVDGFSDEVSGARRDASLATELLRVVPGLLGGDETRRYLVVFITPAELRGAGGFVGSYAELKAVDGDVDLVRSGRIDDLLAAAEPGVRSIKGQKEYLARYGQFQPADFLQDTTYSPDWPTDADVLAQLYPQSGGSAVDGVIAVDPTGLAALLELTGPVTVEGLGTPLSSDNAVSLLTRDQYLLLGDRAQRGDILAAATKATFEKLTSASLPTPRRLGAVLGPAARGRHLQLWSKTKQEQALFKRVHADGHVVVPKGQDGLLVVNQNTGNNKIDAYLRREVHYDASIDARTGQLSGKVRIVLHNDVPLDPLPSAVIDNTRGFPAGSNVGRVSVYTPQAMTGATIDGAELVITPVRELGLNVWDTPLLTIPAGKSITIEVDLAGGVDLRKHYRFTYLPQPVANADVFSGRIEVRNGHFAAGSGQSIEIKARAEAPLSLVSAVSR